MLSSSSQHFQQRVFLVSGPYLLLPPEFHGSLNTSSHTLSAFDNRFRSRPAMVRFRVGFCTYTHDSPLPVTDELLAENASEFSRKWTGDARRQRRRTRNGRKLCTKCAKKSKVIVLCRWPPAESFEEDRDGKESASEQNELSSDEKIPDSKDDEQSTANNKSARENNEPPRMQSQPWGTTNTFSYRRLVASGYINGKSLDAVADSGASFSVISQELAGTLGLHTDMASAVSVCLPSGRMIRTLGKTAGVFRFSGEEESYTLLCIVLEKCAHPLVLGSQFLRATHTLTKYTNRVKNVFSNILGLNFMGVLEAEQHLLHGYLNGQSVDVVPDTGSDIMAMSLQFALQLDLTIYVGHQNRTTVQFIDGSEAWTIGMVRGVKWDFLDSWRYALDREEYEFHVIQHLPVDVIVNNDFIQKFKVFKRHKHVLVLRRPKEFQPGIYGIRFINSLHGHKKEQCRSQSTATFP